MNLADQIIEHGPWAAGEFVLMDFAVNLLTADGLNQLRDELIERRRPRAAAEVPERFEVRGLASCEDAQIVITCDRCGNTLWVSDEPMALAELNRRAAEHAEECR